MARVKRWSLFHQILWPLLGIVVLAHAAILWITIQMTAASKRREIEARLAAVVQTIEQANFPLTERVLAQMKGLSGAEFALRDATNQTIAATRSGLPSASSIEATSDGAWAFVEAADADGVAYFATSTRLPARPQVAETLHVYYPAAEYHRQRWEAVRPVVIVGLVSATVAAALAAALAVRLSRPIVAFRRRVERFITTPFEPLPVPQRNDELRDLVVAFNHVGDRLRAYEETIRQTEHVRVLGLMRGGIAHHLRNLIMGAQVALEVHQTHRPEAVRDESLAVASRQLSLMERYLQQFVEPVARSATEQSVVIMNDVASRVVELVRPNAQHLGVHLETVLPPALLSVIGDGDALEQALLNLLLNGLDAATAASCPTGNSATMGIVRLRVAQGPGQLVSIVVEDNGLGPAAELRARMFEPFVTDKPDGIGLGLAVVKRVAEEHGGRATCHRDNGWTRLELQLPMADQVQKGAGA